MKYYYIHKHLPSEHQDMLDGPRIVELKTNEIILHETDGEGPFESILHLKKGSNIYRQLLSQDQKRAEKIVKEEFIVCVKEIIFWPDGVNEEFYQMIYRILQHSKNGKVNRSGVSGIHLYNKDKIKITKIIKSNHETGIFEAEIEVLNDRTGKYVKKEGSSSFFPVDWGLQRLILECFEAFNNKIEIDKFTYHGITTNGIKLEFVYDGKKVFKSVYPILDL